MRIKLLRTFFLIVFLALFSACNKQDCLAIKKLCEQDAKDRLSGERIACYTNPLKFEKCITLANRRYYTRLAVCDKIYKHCLRKHE